MLRKRYRVFVDVDVSVLAITRERLRRQAEERALRDSWLFGLGVPGPLPDERQLAPQRALLSRLLRMPDALNRYLGAEALSEVGEGTPLDEQPIELDYDSFLAPMVERLPPRARARMRGALAATDRDPLLDEFFLSFRHRVRSTATSPLPLPAPHRHWEPDLDRLVTARFRVAVDVDVDILPLSMDTIRRRHTEWERRTIADGLWDLLGRRELPEPPEVPYAQELQDVLLRDPDALDRFLKGDILPALRDGAILEHDSRPRDDGILAVIETLPTPHRRRLLSAAADERLEEALWQFIFSFETRFASLSIFEAPAHRRMAG